jgi:hypothetical protein
MRKHICLFVCALMACVSTSELFLTAQDPSVQPLIQFADLIYVGAFRLPRAPINGDDFSGGGEPFTYNPVRNSLFIGSRRGNIAEVAIPELNKSADVNTLWFTSYLQAFVDPTEGNVWQWAPTDAGIESILVHNNKLFGSGAIYYDANNIQRVSHYARSLDLGARTFQGMVPVWQADKMGFVSGFMANVPPEWQALLGGQAITGQCCTPIAWKTSWGPSAFAFNPADIGVKSPVPATPLLYYPQEHPTLGHWSVSSATYGATTLMSGVAMINGTRTALYFGSNGTGAHCYGNGTYDQSLHLKPSPDGAVWCYDPTNTDKGSHAYPYRYQIWAYDLNELAAVKRGLKQPWEVVPYGVWPFELPVPEIHARLGGVAYDPQRQLLYLSQLYGDKDGYANRSLIHVLKVNNAPATLPLPVATTPPPSGSGMVSTVTIAPDKPAPQPPGSTITWTATATGGVNPREYQWWVNDGVSWTPTGWSTSNVFNWTPAVATPVARVAVRVRSYASLVAYEATTEWYYSITGTAVTPPPPPPPPPSSTITTAVALQSNLASPQPPNTVITWTASPTGGVAPHQYQWWVYNGSWTAGAWTTSNTFTWQPTVANANYRVAVWVRSAGATGGYEASFEKFFPISGTAVAPPPPPPPASTATVTAVTLTSDRPSPQPAHTQINWTATPAGGTAPHQYQWWVSDGASWSAVTAWTTANTYAWVPTAAQSNYRVAVWVRSAGSSGGSEASVERWYSITAAVAPPPPPPTSTAPTARVSSVGLTSNVPSPQPVGTSIAWTASPDGGTAPHQYQWWIYNGTTWLAATSWTNANTYTWQPAAANTNYRVAVWVRSAGSTGGAEASTERWFNIAPSTAPPPPVEPAPAETPRASAVSIAANLPSPQLVNTAITWTATVTGGAAPYQYQWWTYNGSTWTSHPWTSSATFLWQPTVASATARVAVYVRSAWNTGPHETSGERFFPIK